MIKVHTYIGKLVERQGRKTIGPTKMAARCKQTGGVAMLPVFAVFFENLRSVEKENENTNSFDKELSVPISIITSAGICNGYSSGKRNKNWLPS